MNKAKYIVIAIIIFLALIVVASSAFIIDETKQVVITQFGKPVGKPIVTPGIHFKIPIIQKANFFDKRFLEWDGDPNQVPTKDKRFVWVDTYARWQITDPLLFFQRVRDERGALSRLDDILDGEVRNQIAKHNLVEIIRTTNREFELIVALIAGERAAEEVPKIEYGREGITRFVVEAVADRTRELGVEVHDLRFKRINYVKEVRQKIFDRMIAERKRMAEKFRSEGQGEGSKILGDKGRDLKKIQSAAYKTAQEIMGKADAEATTIYARAYNQSKESQEFYRFLKTMETYQTTLSEKDWLILSTKGDFFKYLQKQSGR